MAAEEPGQDAVAAELAALGAIFGDALTLTGQRSFDVGLPTCPRGCTVRVELPSGYPAAAPPELSAPWLGRRAAPALEALVQREWTRHAGEPCLYSVLDCFGELVGAEEEAEPAREAKAERAPEPQLRDDRAEQADGGGLDDGSGDSIHITSMPASTTSKSTFQAHYARVASRSDVQRFLSALRADRKIAAATHNILAYRIAARDGRPLQEDCDDDGESGASSRVLFVLQRMGAEDLAVVVSRWFGGVLLGPARFGIICEHARLAVEHAMAQSARASGNRTAVGR
jgi:hypothetical protein